MWKVRKKQRIVKLAWNAFLRLIAQLPFSLTEEIRRRLEKIEWILKNEETLKDIADEKNNSFFGKAFF